MELKLDLVMGVFLEMDYKQFSTDARRLLGTFCVCVCVASARGGVYQFLNFNLISGMFMMHDLYFGSYLNLISRMLMVLQRCLDI